MEWVHCHGADGEFAPSKLLNLPPEKEPVLKAKKKKKKIVFFGSRYFPFKADPCSEGASHVGMQTGCHKSL